MILQKIQAAIVHCWECGIRKILEWVKDGVNGRK